MPRIYCPSCKSAIEIALKNIRKTNIAYQNKKFIQANKLKRINESLPKNNIESESDWLTRKSIEFSKNN
jgi:hypothetical protein